jgi:hypothetical protein
MSLGQPKPPNPTDIANASIGVTQQQAGINTGLGQESQAGSNYNQYDPYGSLTYQQTGTGPGGTPIYSSSTNLSPTQQNLLNLLQGTKTTAGGSASNLLSGANYGAAQPSDVIGNMTSGITGQRMASYLSASDPFFKTQTEQLDTQLRNQGLAPGSPAYDNAMRSNTTNQGYAVEGAAANFQPQAFNQATQLYGLPADMATKLASFGAPVDPTAELRSGAALQIQPPNASGNLSALSSAYQNSYQDKQNQYNAMISGLMGIGNGAMNMFSGGGGGAGFLGSLTGAGSAGAPAAGLSAADYGAGAGAAGIMDYLPMLALA